MLRVGRQAPASQTLLALRLAVARRVDEACPAGERPTRRAEMEARREPGGKGVDVCGDHDRHDRRDRLGLRGAGQRGFRERVVVEQRTLDFSRHGLCVRSARFGWPVRADRRAEVVGNFELRVNAGDVEHLADLRVDMAQRQPSVGTVDASGEFDQAADRVTPEVGHPGEVEDETVAGEGIGLRHEVVLEEGCSPRPEDALIEEGRHGDSSEVADLDRREFGVRGRHGDPAGSGGSVRNGLWKRLP